MEDAFDYLDAPVRRAGGAEVPMPYAAGPESLALPDSAAIEAALRSIL